MSFTIDDAIIKILATPIIKKEKRETERERRSREKWLTPTFVPILIPYLFYSCDQYKKTYKWGVKSRYPPIEK